MRKIKTRNKKNPKLATMNSRNVPHHEMWYHAIVLRPTKVGKCRMIYLFYIYSV